MFNQSSFTRIAKENNNPVFNFFKFEENCFQGQVQRNNFFSLIWVKEGYGKVRAGFSEFDFEENSLFAFEPFQPFLFSAEAPIKGIVINFNSQFIFATQHEKEKTFREVLYNNIARAPLISIDVNSIIRFNVLCENIESEMQNPSLAQREILVSYLKIFLINVSRLKMEQQPQTSDATNDNKEHYLLQKLKDAIDENFRAKHSPNDYAAMLYVNTKTLAKISKSYFNRTLSDIINERIIIEAKSELFLTNKAIKEIAYELGYEDEYYFSRFFKVNTKVSPKKFREMACLKRA